jgi:hypothetical protein
MEEQKDAFFSLDSTRILTTARTLLNNFSIP